MYHKAEKCWIPEKVYLLYLPHKDLNNSQLLNISTRKEHPWKMDHEIEVIRHFSPVVFKFAVFRGTHLPGGGTHMTGVGMLVV